MPATRARPPTSGTSPRPTRPPSCARRWSSAGGPRRPSGCSRRAATTRSCPGARATTRCSSAARSCTWRSADPRPAADDLRELGRRLERQTILNPAAFGWRSLLARALAGSDPEEAEELATAELQAARAFGAPRAIAIALQALAVVARGDAQIELLREAVDVLDGSPARLERARATVGLGAALRRQGHNREAREVLRDGLDQARRCGADALSERASEELRTAGARPRRDALRGRDALTASEARVARMAADGMTNREIAEALFVVLRTVETHLTSVYRKLEIGSRAELGPALAAYEPPD